MKKQKSSKKSRSNKKQTCKVRKHREPRCADHCFGGPVDFWSGAVY